MTLVNSTVLRTRALIRSMPMVRPSLLAIFPPAMTENAETSRRFPRDAGDLIKNALRHDSGRAHRMPGRRARSAQSRWTCGKNHSSGLACHYARDRGAGDPGLIAAGALRSDLFGSRHDDDFLRGHAIQDRTDELRCAAPTRRPRRGVPDAEPGRLQADRHRRVADQYFPGGGRLRAHRVAAVSTVVRADLFARGRRRLLPLVAANGRCKLPASERYRQGSTS